MLNILVGGVDTSQSQLAHAVRLLALHLGPGEVGADAVVEALIALARRAQRLELDGEPSFGTPSGIYGLESLPLRFAWA